MRGWAGWLTRGSIGMRGTLGASVQRGLATPVACLPQLPPAPALACDRHRCAAGDLRSRSQAEPCRGSSARAHWRLAGCHRRRAEPHHAQTPGCQGHLHRGGPAGGGICGSEPAPPPPAHGVWAPRGAKPRTVPRALQLVPSNPAAAKWIRSSQAIAKPEFIKARRLGSLRCSAPWAS